MNTAKLKAAAERAKAAVADYQSGVIDAAEFHRRAAEFHRLTDSPEQTLELIAQADALVAAHMNLKLLADVYRQAYEEALEHYKPREARVTKLVLDNERSWEMLCEKLEAAEAQIVELEARTVKLPSINPQMFNDDVMFGYRKAQREAVEFCAAAGINLETGGE